MSQGPGELVRPVPEPRRAAGSPAHTLHPALQSSTGPRTSLPPPTAATGIPGQAQQDLCKGQTPAKQRHEAFASPRHYAPGDQSLAVLAPRTHCGWVLPGAHRVQGPDGSMGAPLCPWSGLWHKQPGEQMVWLKGRGVVPGTWHSLLLVPRHNACLTPMPPGTAPVLADFALWQHRRAAGSMQTCLAPDPAAQLQL